MVQSHNDIEAPPEMEPFIPKKPKKHKQRNNNLNHLNQNINSKFSSLPSSSSSARMAVVRKNNEAICENEDCVSSEFLDYVCWKNPFSVFQKSSKKPVLSPKTVVIIRWAFFVIHILGMIGHLIEASFRTMPMWTMLVINKFN